ncbi:hypothetical protein ACTFIZ_001625 [Dictyostelium cf. discoideum]
MSNSNINQSTGDLEKKQAPPRNTLSQSTSPPSTNPPTQYGQQQRQSSPSPQHDPYGQPYQQPQQQYPPQQQFAPPPPPQQYPQQYPPQQFSPQQYPPQQYLQQYPQQYYGQPYQQQYDQPPYAQQPQQPPTSSLAQMAYPPQQQQQQQQQQLPPQPMTMVQPSQPMMMAPVMLPNGSGGVMSIATIDTMLPPSVISDNKLIPSLGSTFHSNPNGKGKIRVRIISASNLEAADANGYSDPYIKLKSTSIASSQVTEVINSNLNPIWDEELIVEIDQVSREVMIFDVYDHDLIGNDDFLGFVGIDIALLPMGIEVVTHENLSFAKHGTIQIGLTALDFGLTNLSQNYLESYVKWRSDHSPALQRKDFKQIKKDISSKKEDALSGPFIGKTTHHDYRFVNGFLKRKKTKRQVAGNVILKVVGYTLLLPYYALAGS